MVISESRCVLCCYREWICFASHAVETFWVTVYSVRWMTYMLYCSRCSTYRRGSCCLTGRTISQCSVSIWCIQLQLSDRLPAVSSSSLVSSWLSHRLPAVSSSSLVSNWLSHRLPAVSSSSFVSGWLSSVVWIQLSSCLLWQRWRRWSLLVSKVLTVF